MLFLVTSRSLTCAAPVDSTQWAVSIVTSEQETHYSDEWLLPVVMAIFAYGVLCYVIGMFIGPALINAGLLECAILAALKNVHTLVGPTWHLKVRILVMSAYEVVYNLYTGWFCGEDSRVPFFSDLLNVIPVFTAIGIAGLVLIFIALALVIRTKLWDR